MSTNIGYIVLIMSKLAEKKTLTIKQIYLIFLEALYLLVCPGSGSRLI